MTKISMVLTIVLAAFTTLSNAQLYNFIDDPSGSYSSIATNTTATGLTRFHTLDEDPSCGTGFSSFRHTKSLTYSTNKPAIDFSITPDAGYELNVTSISVEMRRNLKGPTLWRIAYSTDGGTTWTNNGSDFGIEQTDCFTFTTLSWDIDDFTTTSSVLVRIIGFGAFSGLNGVSTVRNIVLDGSVEFTDADGDGYASDLDCNDADAAINPGATEICNELDDNCNGSTDEDTGEIWYADADGDSYGDPAATIMTCIMPDGYVTNDLDCNDGSAEINPDATEVCNGEDDNCDGTVDEGVELTIGITPTGIIELCKPEEITLTATADYDSYQWYKNGVALEGVISFDYTTNKPGYYQVQGFMGECSSPLSEVQAVAVYESPNGTITYPFGLDLCASDSVLLKADYADDNSWQWYLGDGPITGATDYKYVAETPGEYYCIITNEHCETTTESVSVTNCRLSGGTAQNSLAIYPNPVVSEFTILFTSEEFSNEQAILTITDIAGNIILSETVSLENGTFSQTIKLGNNYAAGLYIVSLQTNNMFLNQQFIVNR